MPISPIFPYLPFNNFLKYSATKAFDSTHCYRRDSLYPKVVERTSCLCVRGGMRQAGTSVSLRQAISGQKTAEMTEKTYEHVSLDEMIEAAKNGPEIPS